MHEASTTGTECCGLHMDQAHLGFSLKPSVCKTRYFKEAKRPTIGPSEPWGKRGHFHALSGGDPTVAGHWTGTAVVAVTPYLHRDLQPC